MPPIACASIFAIPTASVGAPPARDKIEFSPMSTAVWLIISGVIVKPQPEITCAAFAAVVPITADGSQQLIEAFAVGGEFFRKTVGRPAAQ